MFSQAMWSSIKKSDLPETFRVCHPFINHLVYATVYGKGDFWNIEGKPQKSLQL